jgi:DNA repair protein RadA/Sms
MAIASSLTNRAIDSDLVCFGEVGLSGEVRGVHRVESRLQEAKRMGFKRAILPKVSLEKLQVPADFELIPVSSLRECMNKALDL